MCKSCCGKGLGDDNRFVHFGQELSKVRKRRGLSQEKLARASGLSRNTIANAELSEVCRLTESTMRAIMQVLSSASPPLDAEEALWLGQSAKISRAQALQFVPEEVKDHNRAGAEASFSRLLVLFGPEHLSEVLDSIYRAATRARTTTAAPPSERRYLIKQPPVQREGFIEEVETEYTEADPPPPPARKKAANGA